MNKKQKLNKKGSILDIFIISAAIFGLSIAIIIGSLLMTEFDAALTQNDTVLSSEGVGIIESNSAAYTPIFQGIFIFAYIGLIIATAISAFFIRTHPAFFVIAVILLAFFTLINAVLSDVYIEFESTSQFQPITQDFALITFVMNNFPLLMIFVGILIAIVLYSKITSVDL